MVQAEDAEPQCSGEDNHNVNQALTLLNEMNTNAQHVVQLVDNMIQKVRNGELSTSQGLSFLEMKYHMLLSYLINVTYVVLRKCSGETIDGDPSIDRLVEIRTVLEKIRPIDHKLKYQIDKFVKTAVTGTIADGDSSAFRANPDNLVDKFASDDDNDTDHETDATPAKEKTGKYVPPKLAAVHYDLDEPERNKQLQARKKRQNLQSALMDDLREEYLDAPREISHNDHAQQSISRFEKEKQEYEENYLTRLPQTKADKNRRKKFTTIGTLGDEFTHNASNSSLGSKSKRKRKGGKVKGKPNKKRRVH